MILYYYTFYCRVAAGADGQRAALGGVHREDHRGGQHPKGRHRQEGQVEVSADGLAAELRQDHQRVLCGEPGDRHASRLHVRRVRQRGVGTGGRPPAQRPSSGQVSLVQGQLLQRLSQVRRDGFVH